MSNIVVLKVIFITYKFFFIICINTNKIKTIIESNQPLRIARMKLEKLINKLINKN